MMSDKCELEHLNLSIKNSHTTMEYTFEEEDLSYEMEFLFRVNDSVTESESSSMKEWMKFEAMLHELLIEEIPYLEKQKAEAKSFIQYLIKNRLINIESILSEKKMMFLFDCFVKRYPSKFSYAEISSTLRSIEIIKTTEELIVNRTNNFIEFREHLFLDHQNENLMNENELPTEVEIHGLKHNENFFVHNSEFKCTLCHQIYEKQDDLNDHYDSDVHILKKLYRKNKSWFCKKIKNLEIHNTEINTMDINEQKSVEITFRNTAENYSIHILKIFEMVDLEEVKTEYSSCCRIEKDGIFKVTLKVSFTQYGARIFPIVIQLLENDCETFQYLLIEPTFHIVAKEISKKYTGRTVPTNLPDFKRCIIREEAKPFKRCIIPDTANIFPRDRNKTSSAKRDEPKPSKWGFRNKRNNRARRPIALNQENNERKETIAAPRISRELEIPKLNLPPSFIPKLLNDLFKAGFKTDAMRFSIFDDKEILRRFKRSICEPDGTKVISNENILNMENYVERFHFIMWLEEFQAIQEIRSYNQDKVMLKTDKLNSNLMGISLPGLSEGRPSVLKGDRVIIIPKGYAKKFEGVVESVGEDSIYVKMDSKFYIDKLWKYPADINFRFNRTPLKMSHKALDDIRNRNMEKLMFPTSCEEDVKSVQLKPFFNKSIEGNELQIQAITNIIQNRAYPAPYILFGPPGTGKTATLVEAITQLWSTFNDSRICVCASSNTAADVIACRLLNYIPITDIIRIYGLSRSDVDIKPDLKTCCNFDPLCKEIFFPSISELKKKRIVVMTPVTAGRLVLSGISFDYLFMDEAGHTVEVDMLIPIVGFLKKNISLGISGSLILAGDHKQLGPVVRSPTAIACGYGMSLLERLMKQCDLYKKDPLTSQYNPKVVTKLVNNYRSHETILHVPNSRFYDDELVAKGSEERISCLNQWKKLPAKNFPIIFHSVKGEEERESSSPSYFNQEEIDVVEKYVKDLFNSKEHKITEDDIGIISPYRKQVHKIRQRLANSWPNISVASVEEFQGQEKKIIVISTVRSRYELLATDYKYGLGFLKNEKRFNVAITRAMSLLIVIGNPDILQCDPNWRAFLEYCTENSGFVGEPASGTLPPDFDPNEEVVMNLAALKV